MDVEAAPAVDRVFELPDARVVTTVSEVPGAPALVFVPGWCCPRTGWTAIADHFRGRYSTVLVDLPGQGDSTTAKEDWSVADFAGVVAEVIDRLGWDSVTVVGHSLGGAVAVETAASCAAVTAVVCVDSLVYESYYPRQEEEFILEVLEGLSGDFPTAMRALVEALFTPDGDPQLIALIAAEMAANPQAQALGSQRGLLEWDRDTALDRCAAPVSVLASAAFLTDEARSALSGRVDLAALDLGGHFYLREQPAATAEAIAAVL